MDHCPLLSSHLPPFQELLDSQVEVQRELEARQEEVEDLQARVAQLEGRLAQGESRESWGVASRETEPVETLEAKVRSSSHQGVVRGGGSNKISPECLSPPNTIDVVLHTISAFAN